MARRDYEDDGRTIANMNVEGMPWYRPKQQAPEGQRPRLNREQSRAAIWGILKAALLVSAVFAAVFFLFILFCDKVWFGN